VARDDLLDAMAVCWTVEGILKGKGVRISEEPKRDSRGLRIEIVR
jgi:predicted RNase H-like nuclease